MWSAEKKGFKAWLQLEKSLSAHSVDASLHDIDKLTQFLSTQSKSATPDQVQPEDLSALLRWVNELGMTASSQSRIVSGLRSFFKYCLLENIVKHDPTQLLETPRLRRLLPDFLTVDEIN